MTADVLLQMKDIARAYDGHKCPQRPSCLILTTRLRNIKADSHTSFVNG